MDKIKEATENDIDLRIVTNYCNNYWPTSINNVPSNVKSFFHIRSEIDGILFKIN